MSVYSLSSLKSTTKYGIVGFIVGCASAYSLCSIWSDTGSGSSSSSRSSSSGSGYDDNNSYNSSGTGTSSMFGGGTTGGSARHRKKGHKIGEPRFSIAHAYDPSSNKNNKEHKKTRRNK